MTSWQSRAEQAETQLAQALSDAKFYSDRFDDLEGRMVPLDKDAPFVELFGIAEIAAGYNDDDFDAQVGKRFIRERYALRTALGQALAEGERLKGERT